MTIKELHTLSIILNYDIQFIYIYSSNTTWSGQNSRLNSIESTLNKLGTCTKATGNYTTAVWAYGTTTCTWTAPYVGMYLAFISYNLVDPRSDYRKTYKQLTARGTTTRYADDYPLYYDTNDSNDYQWSQFVGRSIVFPIEATEVNQTFTPYVHTSLAGIEYKVVITCLKL